MTDEELPEGLKYSKDYSWVLVEGNTAKVGIVEPAAKKVEEFVFIDLPDEGQEIERNEDYVSLEAVKWSGHISSPVSGKIVKVNHDLFDNPSKINKDPYSSWIMEVELDNKNEINKLMNSREVDEFY